MTEGKRQGKSRKRNILDDTFGRNSFTLLSGPVAAGREIITVWGLLFAQCILGHCHVLSLDLVSLKLHGKYVGTAVKLSPECHQQTQCWPLGRNREDFVFFLV